MNIISYRNKFNFYNFIPYTYYKVYRCDFVFLKLKWVWSVAKHAEKQRLTVNDKMYEVYGRFYFSQYEISLLELRIICHTEFSSLKFVDIIFIIT